VVSYISDALEIIDVTTPTAPLHLSSLSNVAATKLNGAR
jgi:hypothetical protein